LTATFLDYPTTKGIPIDHIDTCSEAVGKMCYRWLDIPTPRYKKMGSWRGATFKEYIQEELAVSWRECLAT
jgi:hypothetical protein